MGALLHTKSTVATYPLIHLIYPTTTMFIKNTALLAFGASAVAASPLGKRQVSSAISAATSAAGSAVGSATSMAGPSSSSMMTGSEMMSSSMVTGSPAQSSAASTVTATGTDAMASSSIEFAVSSVASSAATGTSSAAAPTMTSEANATSPEAFAFGCPDGYSLTYVIGLSSYPEVEITTAYDALMDWGVAIPPPIMPINSTGSGEGAMRSWSLMNLTVTETLNNQTMNETTGFLNQNWNLSMPLEVSPSLIISNATSDLTLYSNSTTMSGNMTGEDGLVHDAIFLHDVLLRDRRRRFGHLRCFLRRLRWHLWCLLGRRCCYQRRYRCPPHPCLNIECSLNSSVNAEKDAQHLASLHS